MSILRILPLTAADWAAVAHIDQLSFPTPWQEKSYLQEVTSNQLAAYYALWYQEQLVGFSGLWMLADELHVMRIAVHPDRRGLGFGALLLQSLLLAGAERGAILATLEVRESGLAAQALYRKHQFELVGRRKRYYKDTKEDGLLFTVAPLDDTYLNWIRAEQQQLWLQLEQAG